MVGPEGVHRADVDAQRAVGLLGLVVPGGADDRERVGVREAKAEAGRFRLRGNDVRPGEAAIQLRVGVRLDGETLGVVGVGADARPREVDQAEGARVVVRQTILDGVGTERAGHAVARGGVAVARREPGFVAAESGHVRKSPAEVVAGGRDLVGVVAILSVAVGRRHRTQRVEPRKVGQRGREVVPVAVDVDAPGTVGDRGRELGIGIVHVPVDEPRVGLLPVHEPAEVGDTAEALDRIGCDEAHGARVAEGAVDLPAEVGRAVNLAEIGVGRATRQEDVGIDQRAGERVVSSLGPVARELAGELQGESVAEAVVEARLQVRGRRADVQLGGVRVEAFVGRRHLGDAERIGMDERDA